MIDTSQLPFAKLTKEKKPKHGIKRIRMKQVGKRVVHIDGEAVKLRQADIQWANAVKERDHWICQKCGKEDLANEAHHVATRRRRPDLRHVLANGKTLCATPCHRWVHDNPIEAEKLGLLSTEKYERVSNTL